jgi:hypothetical protein
MKVDEDFTEALSPRWSQTCIGEGFLQVENSALRMGCSLAEIGRYTDAQIDDYGQLRRADFPWRPPLRLEVRARSSHAAAATNGAGESGDVLRGTAGFGFWNYPFSPRGDILMLPDAIWFFYASPPSNMALVPGLPGWGWKAQVVHTLRLDALVAVTPMALSAAWARLTGETRPAQRWLQRLSGASEALLQTSMQDWHTYVIEWLPEVATFWVDDQLALRTPQPPRGPLGFVAWLDNQFAVATPRGTLRFGTVASGSQWIEIDYLNIQ